MPFPHPQGTWPLCSRTSLVCSCSGRQGAEPTTLNWTAGHPQVPSRAVSKEEPHSVPASLSAFSFLFPFTLPEAAGMTNSKGRYHGPGSVQGPALGHLVRELQPELDLPVPPSLAHPQPSPLPLREARTPGQVGREGRFTASQSLPTSQPWFPL